jgi:hypothetical protein
MYSRTRSRPSKHDAIVQDAAGDLSPDQEVTVLSDNPKAQAEALESVAKWEEKHGSFKTQQPRTGYIGRRSFQRR